MALAYLLLFLLGVLIAYLVLSLMAGRPLFGAQSRPGPGFPPAAGGRISGSPGRVPKPCPVCGTLLQGGERVKSVVFQGGVRSGNITEKMSHIFGCPFCYPANTAHPRICPVCRRIMPPDGHLIARMFERPDRPRNHVRVLGCTDCRNRKR